MNTPGSPDELVPSPDSLTNPNASDLREAAPRAESIFIDDDIAVVADTRSAIASPSPIVATPRGLPGPGLPEALLWVIGCFAAHIVGFVAMFVLALVLTIAATGAPPSESEVDQIVKEQMLFLTGGEQLVFVLFAMAAIVLRFGSRRASQLGLRLPRFGHGLLVVALMLPLAFVSGECFHVATLVWQAGVESVNESLAGESWWIPIHEFIVSLDKNQAMKVMKEMSGAPLPLLLMIIAVAPALGEEMIFRGLIGRGLVARWGIVRGVLLTSLLFGVVHMHPAHALAVIPLGIAMHFVYLTTRSFWAPVLLHFLNNAWATIVTKYATEHDAQGLLAENSGLPLPVLIESLALAGAIALLLWQTRVRFVLPTGEHWSPQYATVETPPPHLTAESHVHPPTRLLLVHGLLTFAAFVVVLWQCG
jgi:membrane protease YdiL (CAAX protease family)